MLLAVKVSTFVDRLDAVTLIKLQEQQRGKPAGSLNVGHIF